MKTTYVAYVNVGMLDSSDIPGFIAEHEKMFHLDDDERVFIIPTRERETCIECINPVTLSKLKKLKKLNEKILEVDGKATSKEKGS